MPEALSSVAASPYKTLHPTQRRFLAAYEVCGSLTKAARWAKIHRCNHYDWMENPEYAAAFQIADARSARSMEDEAIKRAREGIRKPVWYKGKIVGYEIVLDNTLLWNLVKAGNPEKFRDRSQSDVNLNGSVVVKRLIGVPEDEI